jgi:hypothetical protein
LQITGLPSCINVFLMFFFLNIKAKERYKLKSKSHFDSGTECCRIPHPALCDFDWLSVTSVALPVTSTTLSHRNIVGLIWCNGNFDLPRLTSTPLGNHRSVTYDIKPIAAKQQKMLQAVRGCIKGVGLCERNNVLRGIL